MAYFYIAGTVFFTVYGQLILKWRITRYGALPDLNIEKLLYFIKLMVDPFILSGLFSAFIASLFWVAVMTKLDISFAYPFITAALTITTVALAAILLNEPISLNKSIGILIIIVGISVMSRSA